MSRKTQTPAPDGFLYQADMLTSPEEQDLLARIQELPFKEFEFHGFTGKRRVVYFGWRYDFSESQLRQTAEIPAFLLPLRQRAAAFSSLMAENLPQVLVTEYGPGAAIGWHRDKGVFDEVVGISLLSPCSFRFRRKSGTAWERYTLTVQPRSIYVLRGASRTHWEHSIPGVDALRYSITFRSLRK